MLSEGLARPFSILEIADSEHPAASATCFSVTEFKRRVCRILVPIEASIAVSWEVLTLPCLRTGNNRCVDRVLDLRTDCRLDFILIIPTAASKLRSPMPKHRYQSRSHRFA